MSILVIMNPARSETFALDVFEGPLAFLVHLIQKSEISIQDVPIHEITTQYLVRIKEALIPSVETGAEFIGATSLLLWWKSRHLLPKHEGREEEEELNPCFEVLTQILEYCRFKEVAKTLALREEAQSAFFTRGIPTLPPPKKQLGIEHLNGQDLAALFQKVLEKAATGREKILEETWKVSDKIKEIKKALTTDPKVPFCSLFSATQSKGELIVSFLALLELMKMGECFVEQNFIYKGSYDTRLIP